MENNNPGDICRLCYSNNTGIHRRIADESDWARLEDYKHADSLYNTSAFIEWVESVCWVHSPWYEDE